MRTKTETHKTETETDRLNVKDEHTVVSKEQ